MPDLPTNAQIAAAFEELGDLYELDGVSQYRFLAYRTAAKAIRDAPTSVAKLTLEGTVTELSGVGKTIEEKTLSLIETGDIPAAVKLRAKYPEGVIQMIHLPGFGAKRARRLYDELGIDTLEALKAAAEQGRIRELKGFGQKVEEQLLDAMAAGEDGTPAPRIVLSRALEVGEQLVEALKALPGVEKVEIAGSARRLVDAVKDLDLIATASEPKRLAEELAGHELIEQMISSGDNAARAITHTGIKVDLKVVEPDQFGNVMQHFTGSKAHNVALREAAVRKGLHVSEYGIKDDSTGETYRCETEEEVYERLGYAWIPPELREDRGELKLAATGGDGLPRLVEQSDLRGDLHCHTVASDGQGTLEEMAQAAIERGYEFLCITDHSATHGFGDHVTPDQLRAQIERVRELDAKLGDDFTLLIGTETNILPDGSPDYDDDLLSQLDWVVGSVHTAFNMRREGMTDRVLRAVEHPWIDCIGHPTGRKISYRPPYELDVDRLIEAAARTGTIIEINGAPDRRDLHDVHARAAADAGVLISIDSDAHSPKNLGLVRFGVYTARRARLGPEQIANARPWAELAPLLKRARSRA